MPPFDGWVAIVCVTVPHALVQSLAPTAGPSTQFTGAALETVKGSAMYMTLPAEEPQMALSSTLATSVAVHEMASDDDLPPVRSAAAAPSPGTVAASVRIPIETNPDPGTLLKSTGTLLRDHAVVVVCNAHVAKRGAPLARVREVAPLLMNEEGRADTGEISAQASVREATFM